MVQLTTQAPEVAKTSVAGPDRIYPPVTDLSGITKVIGQTIETKGESRNLNALADLAVGLLDPAAINEDLQPFGGLTEGDAAALVSVGTDAAKFRASVDQRRNARSGSLRRTARIRQFIAENPLLVEEGLKLYENALGRTPGDALRELEKDQMGVDLASLDPVNIYRQEILDFAKERGMDISKPYDQIERVVRQKQQILSDATIAKAKWERLDSDLKIDEAVKLENYMTSSWPLFVDHLTGSFAKMELPTSAADRAAAIKELRDNYNDAKIRADYEVGTRGQNNPTYVAAWETLSHLLDTQVRLISGEDVADVEKIDRDRLQWMVDNITNYSQKKMLSTPIVLANGQPATAADLLAGLKPFQNVDLSSVIQSGIAGVDFQDSMRQILALSNVPIDVAPTLLSNYGADTAKVAFNQAIGIARGAARGMTGFTTEAALNAMESYFGNWNILQHVPNKVKDEVLAGLADPTVSGFLLENGFDLSLATQGPMSNYIEESIRAISEEAKTKNVSIKVYDNGNGYVSVGITPKSSSVWSNPQLLTEQFRRDWKDRIEALIQARMMWNRSLDVKSSAQESLDLIMEGKGDNYILRAPAQDDAPTE